MCHIVGGVSYVLLCHVCVTHICAKNRVRVTESNRHSTLRCGRDPADGPDADPGPRAPDCRADKIMRARLAGSAHNSVWPSAYHMRCQHGRHTRNEDEGRDGHHEQRGLGVRGREHGG